MSTVQNYAYTGKVQKVTLLPGRYRLEVWGAQGGYRSSSTYGGKGGYAKGEIDLPKGADVFIYVGGAGNTGGTAGGFNGGGKRSSYPGGGGGTDIRIGTDSLFARVIVAGGGGSDGASNKQGMYGGGETGGSTTQSYGSGGYGGTQTGNTWQADKQSTNTSSQSDCNAGFGFGGNGVSSSGGYGGGGGGGWYGGSGSYPDGSGDDDRGAGGGSGFVWTGKNAPTGYLLTAAHQLINTSLIAGNASMPSTSGSTETGHSGNGYARITVLELYPQTPDVPQNFRQVGAQDYFSVSLQWGSVECNGYNLYRDGAKIATLTGTTYTDNDLQPSTTYTYTLRAYNAEGESDPATVKGKTKEGWAIKLFAVTAASISPNPVSINGKALLSVTVEETIKILEPELWYSGELYSGEV